jgi:phytoene dehydrogenase-like protein
VTGGRIVIIGAGHNGLVAAFGLARAGLKPLVLESRAAEGGVAATEEIHPGFRCPTLIHTMAPLAPELSRALALERQGFELLAPSVKLFVASRDGQPLTLFEDAERTSRELKAASAKDAEHYPLFASTFRRIGRVLRPLLFMTPPPIDHPSAGDLWRLLGLGRGFRSLGKKDAYRLLRWGPMAVADLAAEWFETPALRAAAAARGIYASHAGPWSAGTSVPLLLQAALDGQPMLPSAFPRGGSGALARALSTAARAAGAEIRTGAAVARIRVVDGRAAAVILSSGEEITARLIVSNADPKTTFLRLLDPADLDPEFAGKIRNYRCLGAAAKVNFALSGLPDFRGGETERLSGRVQIGGDIDSLERAFDAAKYGEISREPFLDLLIPSVGDPDLAPRGAHVLSAHVQFTPYKLKSGDWAARRKELGDLVERRIAEYAPNFRGLVLARQVLTPSDLESGYGLGGGHLLHGEMAIDQLFAMRPLLGWARYRTPLSGLYLCGSGTHPGGGLTGLPGWNASREILKDLKA